MSKHAIKTLSATDKKLAKLIAAVGPCKLKINSAISPFHSLAESIAYQQLTGKAALTIWTRVLALYDGRYPTPNELRETPIVALRKAGLSSAKVAALHDLATKATADLIPSRAEANKYSNEQLVERLTEVRGTGPWTVEMFLIFGLGRPDVIPAADYGVRSGFTVLHKLAELPKPKDLLAFSKRWKPFRSFAAWYLWRAADLEREKTSRTGKDPSRETAPVKSRNKRLSPTRSLWPQQATRQATRQAT